MPKHPRLDRHSAEEGDVFLLPLKHGGFGLGMVYRVQTWGYIPNTKRKRVYRNGNRPVAAVAFKIVLDKEPAKLEGLPLRMTDICHLGFAMSDKFFWERRWKFLGKNPLYSRETWPMPLFGWDIFPIIFEKCRDNIEIDDNIGLRQDIPDRLWKILLLHKGYFQAFWLASVADGILYCGNIHNRDEVTPEKMLAWDETRAYLKAHPPKR
jgi:hypothetical protein